MQRACKEVFKLLEVDMKIAIISEHASPLAVLGGVDSGGQNVYVAQLGNHLASLGHDVDIFTRKEYSYQNEVAKLRDNLQVIHVPAGPAAPIPKEDILPFMDDFSNFMINYCEQNEKPYDLIHANFWMSGLVAMHLKTVLHIPFVITFHALGKIRRLYQKDADKFPEIRFEIEEEIMREADRIIAECPQDESDMIEFYNADSDKIRMVPCGFDPQEFYPIPKSLARQKLNLPLHSRIMLQLGRIVPRKGIENVIRAFAKFRKEEDKAQLIIVGGNSLHPDPELTPEIGRLQKIAQSCGVSHAVHFVGQVKRTLLKYYYSAADVFITTPWYEPFGITPLEAMACATPVIGAEVGGIKYTVKHGVTGFLVPAQDDEALAGSLKEIYKDPRRHAWMTKKSIKHVNKFTWEKIAHMVNDVYEEVCEEHVCSSVSR
jgi:D-inositol-3-phosphate glycosyltransferase